MSMLLLRLQGSSSIQTTPIAVEVIDENLEVIADLAVSVRNSQEVTVEPGKYLIRAKLPSKDIVTQLASITETDESKEVILKTLESPHEWLEWQYFLGNVKKNSSDSSTSQLPSFWLRLWLYDNWSRNGWSIEAFPPDSILHRSETVIHYRLPPFKVRQLGFLQIGGHQIPWRFIALPPEDSLIGKGIEILVSPSSNNGTNYALSVAVVSREEKAEALLKYMNSGSLSAAKIVGNKILDGIFLPDDGSDYTSSSIAASDREERVVGAVRAAISGYYLLKFKAFDHLNNNWIRYFADTFEWLPDAAIIRAWQLIFSETKSEACIREARERLLQAAWNCPVYSQGLRLLFDGLQICKQDAVAKEEWDEEAEGALERINDFVAAVDWSQPLTTFYGETPDSPSLSLRTGIPEDNQNLLVWVVEPVPLISMNELLHKLGDRFGVLAESDTHQLTVVAKNSDVAVGDLFLLPSRRGGHDRFYIFRTTQYANILNRALEMDDIARNKLTMPDSYLSQNLAEELLIKLTGIVLGYAEAKEGGWTFHKPRRLPEHLSNVYRVDPQKTEVAEVMRSLLASQLGQEGLYVGDLLAGEQALKGVKVFLPAYALSHHLGVFGRTGAGKSNLMMVLLKSVMDYNQAAIQQESQQGNKPLVSMLAIDPHDEFRFWHATTGGKDGIHGIVEGYSPEERRRLVEPFYYLTARDTGNARLERKVVLSRADVLPDDLASISEFSEQQVAFAQQQFANWGENWIARVLMGDTQKSGENYEGSAEFLPGTVSAVQRRLSFLRRGQTRLFSVFDPEMGDEYESLLPDILCALEQGRVLIVDTTLMGEMEQFLLTTVVARSLFTLRRTLRSVESAEDLPDAIRLAFGNDDEQGQVGLRTLAETLIKRVEGRQLPYVEGKGKEEKLRSPDRLPYVNVVVEEAPSVLNPQRMKFGSVFRDISRQGRKFGIGLTVVSQQVSEIDDGVLSQINTELVMALGNEGERRESVRNASADLSGFERELQVMGKGQVIVSASYKDVPLPVQVPEFDVL